MKEEVGMGKPVEMILVHRCALLVSIFLTPDDGLSDGRLLPDSGLLTVPQMNQKFAVAFRA
jgi:hypothetical protein